ncbi:MAG: four helix bundle protein [bacterium]|nr:four helix bundle protein [bacterium]MDT8366468.1 four helix bundle protein [bacterium]
MLNAERRSLDPSLHPSDHPNHFVLNTYEFTEHFPRTEVYGLTVQLKRAVISIAANIAEGFRKRSKAETHRYMEIAHSSLENCQYYLILARDLGYGEKAELDCLLTEISKMLFSYKSALKRNVE